MQLVRIIRPSLLMDNYISLIKERIRSKLVLDEVEEERDGGMAALNLGLPTKHHVRLH